jgi:carbon-monoxide dehydrogenase large subunit
MLMERLVEKAARAMAIEPNELRRINLIEPHEFPYRTPTGETLDSGNYDQLLRKSCQRASYAALVKQRERHRAAGRVYGIGTALYVEPCGQGWESAAVKITRDGRIVATTGSSSQGQGRETAFAQIVASVLALDPQDVKVVHGDTAQIPIGVGALASRSTAIGGSALFQTAQVFREKARRLAAQLLQASVDSVELSKGGFRRSGDDFGMIGWSSIATAAFGDKPANDGEYALETSGLFHTRGEAWSCGCCIATVLIDRETGVVKVERLVFVDDAGLIVNPALADTQLRGGLVQGLGEALLERLVYDENNDLLTGTLNDYALPRACHVPDITIDKLATTSPFNELGAKGVGEAGCIGPPAAIVNAVHDALSPFGVHDLDTPLTSEKIWIAIRNTDAAQADNDSSAIAEATTSPMRASYPAHLSSK